MWSDSDDRHGEMVVHLGHWFRRGIFLQSNVSFRLNMNQPNNDHQLSMTQDARPRYTGERLLRERPKIYRQVVRLLGEGRVSEQDLWSEGKHRQNT